MKKYLGHNCSRAGEVEVGDRGRVAVVRGKECCVLSVVLLGCALRLLRLLRLALSGPLSAPVGLHSMHLKWPIRI